MKRLGFLSLLIAVSAIAARRPCRYRQRGYCKGEFAVALRYLDTSTPSPGVVDPCTAFSSELVAPSFCLRGDGTSTNSTGMALSAVGSPTTQTMPLCGNGLNCGSVSRDVHSIGNYRRTASVAAPSGSFSLCYVGIFDAPLAAQTFFAQDDGSANRAWNAQIGANGSTSFVPAPGTGGLNTAAGFVLGGVEHLVCDTYRYVGAGNVNIGTIYVDGAQAVQSSTQPALPAVSTNIVVANSAARVRLALFTSKELSPTTVANIWRAVAPTPQGTRGEPASDTRNSLSSVSASDGSVTHLQPNRMPVSGGVAPAQQRQNLLVYSEQFDNAAWSKPAAITITANASAGPDGATVAERMAASISGSSGSRVGQQFTASAAGSAYTVSVYARAVGATTHPALGIFDGTTSTWVAGPTSTAVGTASWQRLLLTLSAATAGHVLSMVIFPDYTAGTGTTDFYGAQAETGSVASPYCRSESTSATCSGDQITIPMPSGLSRFEGCAKVCITPAWTGANPLGSSLAILHLNSVSDFPMIPASQNTVNTADGAGHGVAVNANFTAGVKTCFVATWSKSAGVTTITNQTSGAKSTSAAGFTGLAGLDANLSIGNFGGSGGQPLAATISDIQLGASAGACN